MKLYFTLFAAFLFLSMNAQNVADFEHFNLPASSFLNGDDGGGGFASGDVYLPNNYNSQWMSWSGWAISNMTDATTPGFNNQYSAIAGGGANGTSHYAVTYAYGNNNIRLTGAAAGHPVAGMYITNSTYAYFSMLDGDGFSKKFGGLTGNDPDYFLLTVKAWRQGILGADSVNFYLADFRFADNGQDYIVNTWKWVNLSSLGAVDSLNFTLTSTDNGQFGMNTPAYFCVDQVLAADPSGTAQATAYEGFQVYPNPASDFLLVSRDDVEIAACSIVDMTGKAIMHKALTAPVEQIDVRLLPSGSYILIVQSRRGAASRLWVKP